MQRLTRLGVRHIDSTEGGIVLNNGDESSLMSEVKEKQVNEPIYHVLKEILHIQSVLAFEQEKIGVLKYQDRLYLPRVDGIIYRIKEEAHGSRYSIHLVSTKMYHNLREVLLILLPNA